MRYDRFVCAPALSVALLLVLLLLAGVGGPISAQPSDFGIGVSLADPGAEGPVIVNQADFTVRPSVTTSTLGAGEQTLDLVVFCFDIFTGQILPFCDVQLTLARTPQSGGHAHDDANRPIGAFEPDSGNTGSDGLLPVTYTAPEVSGLVQTTITGTTQQGIPIFPSLFTIGVEISGLTALGAGTNYDLVGATTAHGDNHYGTSSFNSSLVTLADKYAAAFPGSKLAYNDMSLVQGGLFDISGAWAPPHRSHRFGVDMDLRLVPAARRKKLRQLINAAGIATILVEGNHWHIRQ